MIYIYGITAKQEIEVMPGIKGIGEGDVSWITYGDLVSVVSHHTMGEEVSLVDARTHEKVLQALIERGASIVPMAFGFSLSDEDMVLSLIKQGKEVFRGALDRVEHRVQVDLKATWDKNIVELALKDEGVKNLLAQSKENPGDLTTKIELGRRVKDFISKREEEVLPSLLRLRDMADEHKDKAVKEQGGILNTSLLLKRSKKKQFLELMEELEDRLGERLSIQAVLPLPPYDFVGIKVEKTDLVELDNARRVLGLGVETDLKEVESSFKRHVKANHPDTSPCPDACERFNEVKEAYETLKGFYERHSRPPNERDMDNAFIFKGRGRETPGGTP